MESSGLTINGDPTKLFEELAKAQAEFIPVPRVDAGQVGNTKFKYAGYATLMKCVRPALSKYGIVIIQPLHSHHDEDGIEHAVTTTILAGHGASIVSSLSFEHDSNPQEFGRKHTYHRRYQLQSMLGIEGDDDADNVPLPKESKPTNGYIEKERDITEAALSGAPPKAVVTNVATRAASTAGSKPATTSSPKAASAPAGTAGTDTAAATLQTKGPEHTPKTINVLLEESMKQLKWNMAQMMDFYGKHVDPAGVEKPSNMTLDQKRALHKKLVEIHDVVPF